MCNMQILQTETFSREFNFLYYLANTNWSLVYTSIYNITYYTFLRFIATQVINISKNKNMIIMAPAANV